MLYYLMLMSMRSVQGYLKSFVDFDYKNWKAAAASSSNSIMKYFEKFRRKT